MTPKRWIALVVFAALVVALVALKWPPRFDEPVAHPIELGAINDDSPPAVSAPNRPAEFPTPTGSRVVPIEINIDDTSHAVINPGDQMDVIEFSPKNADAGSRGYLTLASNAIVSKTNYGIRHPLIYVILEHDLADLVESKLEIGNVRLVYSTLEEN